MAFNTVAYNKYDYVTKLRARLNKPTAWRDVMEVIYTNNYSKIDGYVSTESTVVGGTRGTAYRYNAFAITAETLTISSTKMVASFIDEIDRAQQTYVNQMTMAEYHGKQMSEEVESLVLAQHTNWVDFGSGDLTDPTSDDTTQITVSASNIDDIIRAVKTKIYYNDGVDLAVERGIFIVLRAQDFQALEAFAQANGYNIADNALKNGIPVQKGFHYMGVDVYLSNSHTANHLFAGVKRCGQLGIAPATWGQAKFIDDPVIAAAGPASGIGIVSRIDYGFDWPAQWAEFSMDINVV